VDHRGQHAHVIAGGAVDLKSFLPRAAKNISAAHHHRDLHAQLMHVFQLARDGLDGFPVDAESLRSLTFLPGTLPHDPFVDRLAFSRDLIQCALRGARFGSHESPESTLKISGIVTNYRNPRTSQRLSCPLKKKERPDVPGRSDFVAPSQWVYALTGASGA